MAKPARNAFVCQNCGAVSPRWAGKCAACGEWNSLVEEAGAAPPPGPGLGARPPRAASLDLESWRRRDAPTMRAHAERQLAELDRVTGGGIVPGSALLIGGEPGIGKSTLLLQLAAGFADAWTAGRLFHRRGGRRPGAALRAERLGLAKAPLALACETQSCQHPGDAGRGPARGSRRHRFDPDALGRRAGGCPRHREPGARGHPGAGALRQG